VRKYIAMALAVLSLAVIMPRDLSAITFGLKGGVNFSNISVVTTGEVPDFKNLQGLTGGVFFNLNLGPVGIQPEVLYSRRGMKFSETIEEGTLTVKYMLDYIEVPLLLKLTVVPVGPVRPIVYAGPAFSYLLKAKAEAVLPGVGEESEDVTEQFKRESWGGVVGGGLEFRLPVIKLLSLEARYHFGLSDINQEMEADTVKNKGFSIMVGIGF
jgi:hypothetical protein